MPGMDQTHGEASIGQHLKHGNPQQPGGFQGPRCRSRAAAASQAADRLGTATHNSSLPISIPAACGRRTGNFGPAPVGRLAFWLRPCPWARALRGTLTLVWWELCAAEACLNARLFSTGSLLHRFREWMPQPGTTLGDGLLPHHFAIGLSCRRGFLMSGDPHPGLSTCYFRD
jgi:hypothetical protein